MATPQGEARAAWQVDSGRLRLTATIPLNATGEIWVPTAFGAVGSVPEGATLLRKTDTATVYATGPGSFTFVTEDHR